MCSGKLDTAIQMHINGASPTRKQQLHVTATSAGLTLKKLSIRERES